MFWIRRINKELSDIKKEIEENDIEEWNASPIDEIDLYNWEGFVNGPEDSLYEDGTFYFKIFFKKIIVLYHLKLDSLQKFIILILMKLEIFIVAISQISLLIIISQVIGTSISLCLWRLEK